MRNSGRYIATLWSCTTLSTLLAAGTVSVLAPQHAHAGPVELFDGVQLAPGDANTIAASYMYGDTGVLLSHDDGKSFSLICSLYASEKLKSVRSLTQISGSGVVHMGGFNGLWSSDDKGCNFGEATELSGQYVGALAVDPDDAKKVYAGTASGGNPENGMYVNDGVSKTWTALGERSSAWIQSLHVVKAGAAKRFWQTAVTQTMTTDEMGKMVYAVHYVPRFSEDEGKTWTGDEFAPINQFGPDDPNATFAIVAVDPTNPDHIFALIRRESDVDDLLYSDSQGKAGSWRQLGSPTQFGGLGFGPDGKLYYADYDQITPGFFELDSPAAAPKKVSSQQLGCLRWDDTQKKMLACGRWQFGTVDLGTGAFTSTYDMRCGPTFVDCPGIKDTCFTQLKGNWCDPTHYPAAPLCLDYDIPVAAQYRESVLDYTCVDGKLVDREPTTAAGSGAAGMSGAGGMSGAAPAAGNSAASAGNSASGGAAGTATAGARAPTTATTAGTSAVAATEKSSGGCSTTGTRANSSDTRSGLWLAAALFAGWVWRKRRLAVAVAASQTA